ncbi:MAG: hypothetical protein PHQ75_04395 [Thermoguttaceae bacterium]|nr:hypothetical protein [Thermoguttaceae bacterium]
MTLGRVATYDSCLTAVLLRTVVLSRKKLLSRNTGVAKGGEQGNTMQSCNNAKLQRCNDKMIFLKYIHRTR